MATAETQIGMDSQNKEQETSIIGKLKYNKKTLNAMAEAKRKSGDDKAKSYSSVEELKGALAE